MVDLASNCALRREEYASILSRDLDVPHLHAIPCHVGPERKDADCNSGGSQEIEELGHVCGIHSSICALYCWVNFLPMDSGIRSSGWILCERYSKPPHSAYTTPPASASALIAHRMSRREDSSAACSSG